MFPLALIWVLVSVILMVFRDQLIGKGFDILFIGIANTILFLITYLGFKLVSAKSGASNPHAFMRGVYMSFLIKMFVILGALFIFIAVSEKEIDKSAVFISMGLYIVYTTVEVIQSTKLVRSQKQ